MLNRLKEIFKIQKSDLADHGPKLIGDYLQFDIISIGRHLFANYRLLLFSAITCMAVVGAVLYFIPTKYCSTASILPSGQTDNLSLLKEMTGLTGLGAENNENSSVLYPKILNSRQIREAVLNYRYHLSSVAKTGFTLREYFDTDINEHLLKKLENITSIKLDKNTGLITISVETEYPELSQAIVRRYLAELEDYNINRRKSSARERVKYLKREVVDRETELRLAENDLEQYQMANRNWNMTSDPEILSNLNRKKREITAKTETYLFLKNQLDLAKLEAQKDIPIVRILDNPSLPLVKSGPHWLIIILLSSLFGMMVMAAFLTIVSFLGNDRKSTQNSIEYPSIDRQTTLVREEIYR